MILSPSETIAELEEKLRDYRIAGTRLVWIVNPATRTVSIRSGEEPERVVGEGEFIDGADVLRGFAMQVDVLFARLAR